MKKIIVIIAMIINVLPVLAQGAPPTTPIDGGLSLLLAAGVAAGGYKLWNQKDKE